MNSLLFTVEGDAVGKHYDIFKSGHSKKSDRTTGFEKLVALRARMAMMKAGYRPAESGVPVKLSWVAVFSRPKYHYGTGRNVGTIKERYLDIPHVVKPDIKNIVASLEDACKGIVWADDCQVNKYGSSYKRYIAGGDLYGVAINVFKERADLFDIVKRKEPFTFVLIEWEEQ
jgi:Holliday junction resolvase RusA-like endonuclease